jgi:hypothetical protein
MWHLGLDIGHVAPMSKPYATWHLISMAPRFKHMPHGILAYLGLHICHVAPRCRHMPSATFRLSLGDCDHLG